MPLIVLLDETFGGLEAEIVGIYGIMLLLTNCEMRHLLIG